MSHSDPSAIIHAQDSKNPHFRRAKTTMSQITTHVLDTARGRPAEGIDVLLEDDQGRELGRGTTDGDGRIADLGPDRLPGGRYVLRFDTGSYQQGLYPEIPICFEITDDGAHYHIPLLLSPWAYSTYRGS